MRTFFLILLLASVASAQTYVRPSKGAAIYPFASQADFTGSWPEFPSPNVAASRTVTSRVYDWSAFNGARVTRLTRCDNDSASTSTTETFRELPAFLKFILGINTTLSGGWYFTLSVLGGAVPSVLKEYDTSLPNTNGAIDFGTGSPNEGCVNPRLEIAVTPLPFTQISDVKLSTTDVIQTIPSANACVYSGYRRIPFGMVHPYWGINVARVLTGTTIYELDQFPNGNNSFTNLTQYVKVCNSRFSPYGQVFCRKIPVLQGDNSEAVEPNVNDAKFASFVDYSRGSKVLLPGECAEYTFGAPWMNEIPYSKQNAVGSRVGSPDYECAGDVGQILDVEYCFKEAP